MKPLRILMVEDRPEDVELVQLALERSGVVAAIRRVDDPASLAGALRDDHDVVLTDCSMPQLRAGQVIETVKAVRPSTPVLVVSGSIGEEQAVELLKSGAADFVSKMNLSRLVHAIHRELSDVQARRERADALTSLRDAVRARDDFLAVAAHELKTPVTALKLQVGLLGKLQLAPEAAERVEALSRISDRITQLIGRLLDITDFTGSRPELKRESLDLAALLRHRAAAFEGDAARAGSRLDLSLPQALPLTADRRWLSIAIDNLLQNAIKYGQGKPVRIAAQARSGHAVVEVEDQGMGIAARDQERIFLRFARAVPREHFGGFGLGLWIAREVAAAHGGTLRVRSEPGHGACFTLDLPQG